MRVDRAAGMAKQRKTSEGAPARAARSVASDRSGGVHGYDGLDRDRVAVRAYELFLARGGQHGRDWDDWLTAEQELLGGRASRSTAGREG
jgi:DUF2934 family protein